MVCRDEYLTDTNAAGVSAIIRELRLERIAQIWQDRCTLKYNLWVDEYNRRINKWNEHVEVENIFTEKYNLWADECGKVAGRLKDLTRRFHAHESVTPADWDAAIAGSERKAFAILSPWYPKATWPKSVPYLNLIVLGLHDEEEAERREEYMRHYHVAIQDIKRRGEDTDEMNRIMGDTPEGIGFETPLTEIQVSGYGEMLRVEKRQIEADKAQFLADLDEIILARLNGQPVLDKNWDVEAWAGSVLKDVGVVATDEATERIVQQVRMAIQRWPHHAEPINKSSEEMEMTAEQDVIHEGEVYLPYDV